MTPLMAFAFGGITACTLIRILTDIIQHLTDRHERRRKP